MELKSGSAAGSHEWQSLPILDNGQCEPLKAAVHALALGLSALMGAYNAAAWLRRRQRHLAINAVIYLTAAVWEQRHVAHHLASCLPTVAPSGASVVEPVEPSDDLKVA